MKRRVIALFTGSRAEYGLQFPILKAIAESDVLDYRLLVSGSHLDGNFGRTRSEIVGDGFRIHAEVDIEMQSDTLDATAHAIGSGIISISHALAAMRPDMLIVYGDRFESFAAAIAASQMNIPTAHIEGGDLTEGGALDDSVRHAVTKLAHLHFATNAQSANRVLAMGEEPWRVHTIGLPAIDLIREGRYAQPNEVEEQLSLDLSLPVVLFTQHSVTMEFDRAVEQIRPSLDALGSLAATGAQIVITYPNNDAGGRAIIAELDRRGASDARHFRVSRSLGRHLYHGVLGLALDGRHRVACVGNSSSGIKETPAFGCPTVNIGSRQDGRLRADNLIDVTYDAKEIEAAVRRSLFDEAFRRQARSATNPYDLGGAGAKVVEVLAQVPLDLALLRKRMTLRGETRGDWHR